MVGEGFDEVTCWWLQLELVSPTTELICSPGKVGQEIDPLLDPGGENRDSGY